MLTFQKTLYNGHSSNIDHHDIVIRYFFFPSFFSLFALFLSRSLCIRVYVCDAAWRCKRVTRNLSVPAESEKTPARALPPCTTTIKTVTCTIRPPRHAILYLYMYIYIYIFAPFDSSLQLSLFLSLSLSFILSYSHLYFRRDYSVLKLF